MLKELNIYAKCIDVIENISNHISVRHVQNISRTLDIIFYNTHSIQIEKFKALVNKNFKKLTFRTVVLRLFLTSQALNFLDKPVRKSTSAPRQFKSKVFFYIMTPLEHPDRTRPIFKISCFASPPNLIFRKLKLKKNSI